MKIRERNHGSLALTHGLLSRIEPGGAIEIKSLSVNRLTGMKQRCGATQNANLSIAMVQQRMTAPQQSIQDS
jgi:hypothetical protein